MVDKDFLISEEALIVRHSGEIPEVAYHGAIYYLTKDPDGPGLALAPEDLAPLKEAVVERYRTIILRDLNPHNRDERAYRGITRCCVNWQRLRGFARREGLGLSAIRREVAEGLCAFLCEELADVLAGRRVSCVNCPASSVDDMAIDVGLAPGDLPHGWRRLCPER